MLLSIITGTYNRLPYLKNFVESCRKSLPPNFAQGRDYEFVVTDGGSTDGTLEWMQSQGIRIVHHGELLGAIKAFNDAGAMAAGDYLFVGNDDIEVAGFSLARGLAFMMDNPDVGAGCFYQDRNGRELHVEEMPAYRGTEQKWVPYLQVGLVPRWLWDHCGGWGDWGGRTYGGDNYLSGRIYQTGYKVVPIEGCAISDKVANDALRRTNNTGEGTKDGEILWSKFSFELAEFPQIPNPLPGRKRVLYAPIIEAGHEQAKLQKRGLRDALSALGVVWEVDYIYSKQSVVEAAEAWRPHYVITQFHVAENTSIQDVERIKAAAQGPLINWNGDVWPNQANPEMMEILRHYDYHLTVNASLIPQYEARGIRAAYWQNAWEPSIADNEEIGHPHEVVFLGNEYSNYRTELGKALKSLPYNVGIYGSWRTEGIASGASLYDFRKTGQIYRGAKIAIGDNQFPEATGFCSDRFFMAMAAGNCMLLHQKVEKLDELLGIQDGVHYVSWTTYDDLRKKVDYYMTHEEERADIAAMGKLEARTHQTYAARVEELKGLIERLPKKRDKISVMMIIKNEEANIMRCLKQLEFADEIVVVDTGSEDMTLESLEMLDGWAPSIHPEGASIYEDGFIGFAGKVKVFRSTWVDDFSAARNFAKSRCTGDWILWMDADDRLPERTIAALKNFPWDLRAKGYHNPQAFKLMCVIHDELTREPQGYALQTRMFRNISKVEFRNPVHETVDESLKDIGITPIAFQKMEIHSYQNDARVAESQARNRRILRKMPHSPWKFYQIGSSYAAEGRWGDASAFFAEAEALGSGEDELGEFVRFAKGYALYKMGLIRQAKVAFRGTNFPDALFLLAGLEKDGMRARLLEQFLEAPTPTNLPTFAPLWRDEAKRALIEYHKKALEKLG